MDNAELKELILDRFAGVQDMLGRVAKDVEKVEEAISKDHERLVLLEASHLGLSRSFDDFKTPVLKAISDFSAQSSKDSEDKTPRPWFYDWKKVVLVMLGMVFTGGTGAGAAKLIEKLSNLIGG
jgi:hypothetical protein